MRPPGVATTSGSVLDGACDRCEETFGRVESLLDGGELAEALRLLQRNEAELRQLGLPPSTAVRPRESAASILPLRQDGTVAVAAVADYATANVRSARLLVLMRRVGQLLSRCEAMQEGTVEELRQLRTRRSFESGSSMAGAWFSKEA